MIVLAMFTLNLLHPGILLKKDAQPNDDFFVMSKSIAPRNGSRFARFPNSGSYESFPRKFSVASSL